MGGGPTTEILRPALELAWAVAKAGTQAEPPIAPPAGLQPLMPLTDLTEDALTTIREVVEEDAEFRAKVALWAEQAAFDRELLRWLVRPGSRQSPEPSEWERVRSDAELARLRETNARLTVELTAERAGRHQIERQLQADSEGLASVRQTAQQEQARLQEALALLEKRVASLEADLDTSAERLDQTSKERERARVEMAEMAEQLDEARTDVARLEADQRQSSWLVRLRARS